MKAEMFGDGWLETLRARDVWDYELVLRWADWLERRGLAPQSARLGADVLKILNLGAKRPDGLTSPVCMSRKPSVLRGFSMEVPCGTDCGMKWTGETGSLASAMWLPDWGTGWQSLLQPWCWYSRCIWLHPLHSHGTQRFAMHWFGGVPFHFKAYSWIDMRERGLDWIKRNPFLAAEVEIARSTPLRRWSPEREQIFEWNRSEYGDINWGTPDIKGDTIPSKVFNAMSGPALFVSSERRAYRTEREANYALSQAILQVANTMPAT